MILWHVGATIALTRYAFRDERMDLRFLALGALIPDLIDTPIGLVWWESLGGVRLLAHSLLASGIVMTLVVLSTRRGRPRKRWMPVAIGMLMHLFLDGMWQHPETLWWPFLGLEVTQLSAAGVSDYVSAVLTDWRVWALEGLGIVYLAGLWRKAHLGDADSRKQLLTSGIVDASIDR